MKATRINIRKRQISNGRSSLYLDYYPGVFDRIKKRMVRRETLYLYVYDRPETLADRQHNDEMMELARQIRTKRMIDISSAYYGITKKAALIKGDFLQYFEERCMINNSKYHGVFKHFYEFCNGYCTFEQLSVTMCEQFRHYLLHTALSRTTGKPLRRTTAAAYYDLFLYILKIAYNDNAISSNLAECVSGIRAEGTIKTSLNYEELDRLFKTPCRHDVLRRASIFAVLSGLRRGDILALVWKDYERDNKGKPTFRIVTKKTGAVSHHPVSAEAMEACGPAGDGLIFKGLTANMTTITFKKWVTDAGISKPVTFHTLRHTYATLLHENGNSLHTIQNLMIHLHPGTTAQYICNSDALARKAVDNLHLQPSRLKRIWSKVRRLFK